MKLYIPIALIISVLSLISNIYTANGQVETNLKGEEKATKSTDIVDILQGGFKTHLRKDSLLLKGKGPFISIMPIVGYAMQSGLTGGIVTNTSFYTDDRTRFSNLLINGYTSQYHQFWVTANNTLFF